MSLGRWRRLSRCFEQTKESARAWLEVAAFGYMLGRPVIVREQRASGPRDRRELRPL